MDNTSTLQEIYAAFGRGDVAAILARLSDDVVFEDFAHSGRRAAIPYFARRTGHAGAAEFFTAVAENLEFHSFEPLNFLSGGDEVAVTVRVDLTVRPTGRSLVDEEIHLWAFDASGKVCAMRHYSDTGAHIAAGGREPAVA